MKKISIQLIVFSLLIFLVSCKTTTNNSQSASNQDSASNVQSSEAAATRLSPQTATPSEPNELGIVPISGVDKSDDKKIAPNIKWTSSDGTSKSLNDYKGKVVMLNFWATWCPPCRAELPDIVKLRNELGPKGFEVIGVSVSERLQPGTTIIQLLSKFMNSNKMSYPMLYLGMDSEPQMKIAQEVTSAYGGISGIPSTFIIDKKGIITSNFVGGQSEATFRKAIEAALMN